MMDLGFEDEGFDVAFVNEIYPPFLDGYKFARNRRNEPIFGYDDASDATDFLHGKPQRRLTELIESVRRQGNIVGFIGGPPCPDFSIGGKNMGRDGQNGILSQRYCDLICQFKPDIFLLENVKG